MRKLKAPPFGAFDLFETAVIEMTDLVLQAKFIANQHHLEPAFAAFEERSVDATWCDLPRFQWGQSAQLVAGALTKGELNSLYSDWIVKTKGAPRRLYDKIRVSAHGECPYCGGLGDMGEEGELGTLDHYLPKAYFPAYSTHPFNLIPACVVCNKGMQSSFPIIPGRQPLHPYLDAEEFFTTKWTTANIRETVPVIVDFGVAPPPHWEPIARQRVEQHFTDCNLAKRYRSRVHQELAPLIDQRRTSLRKLSTDEFRDHLFVVSDSEGFPINGWKRTLYAALAASDWFCAHDFGA